MTAIRSNFGDLYFEDALPVLNELIGETFEAQPDLVPKFFRVMPSGAWGEQTSTIAGLPLAEEKGEGAPVTFANQLQGFDKTYKHLTFALATDFSEELVEDNRMGQVEEGYRALGLSMFQTKQIFCFNIYNNGFTDTGPDGVSLFNTAHPLVGGGTYNNRPTTEVALSVAGLREMDTDMMRQVNDRGINIVIIPRQLLVPPELKYIAKELTKSAYKPQTANNEINTFMEDNLEVYISPFLTSATAWFATTEISQTQMRFYERVARTERTWYDEKTGTVNTRSRMRHSAGYGDYKGLWGTTG